MTLADEAVVRATAHRYRGWFTFLGILLIISGALAIAFPLAGSLTVTVWAAVAFLIAGVSQTLHAFMARDWSGFWLGLLIGLLYLATGIVLALYSVGYLLGALGAAKLSVLSRLHDLRNRVTYRASIPPITQSDADAMQRTLCSNIKGDGIEVFTILYMKPLELNFEGNKSLFRECASKSSWSFVASNAATLKQAFKDIGEGIVGLRLTN